MLRMTKVAVLIAAVAAIGFAGMNLMPRAAAAPANDHAAHAPAPAMSASQHIAHLAAAGDIHANHAMDEIQVESAAAINPEELYISSETAARIREAIEKLPAQCQLIFKMVREDGLKHKEVAAILDISELTVRNQLVIAVRKITDAIQPHLPQAALKPRHRFS